MICLVDTPKPRKRSLCDYLFFLVKANSFEEAFDQALKLGKTKETRYYNVKQTRVRWALVKVETIKRLGNDLEGVEAGSILDVYLSEQPIPFGHQFHPKAHLPDFEERITNYEESQPDGKMNQGKTNLLPNPTKTNRSRKEKAKNNV